jgi:UDP-glucose 4-epimerase
MLQNKDILVTGGAGFIGSNLSCKLAEKNNVTVVDNGYLGIKENLDPAIEFYDQSVLEPELPTDVDVVFHLASQSSYTTHEENLTEGTRVNVEGFVNVVAQARQDGCETVVYASSSSLCDRERNCGSGTDTVKTGYEASKLARERYAEYFSNHYDMCVAGMRFLPAYQSYRSTDDHQHPYPNIVAQYVDDIAHKRSPVVYQDGTQTRDFTHVNDIVRGLISAAEHNLTGVYNLGTGRAVSVNELVDMIGKTLDIDVQPVYIKNPVSDDLNIFNTVVDSPEMRAETGWEPRISLEEGIEQICRQYEVRSVSRKQLDR